MSIRDHRLGKRFVRTKKYAHHPHKPRPIRKGSKRNIVNRELKELSQ